MQHSPQANAHSNYDLAHDSLTGGACVGTGEELQGQQEVLQNQLQEAAVQLSTRRRAAAGKLKAAVETCLSSLAMSGSQFSAEICWRAAEQVGSMTAAYHE